MQEYYKNHLANYNIYYYPIQSILEFIGVLLYYNATTSLHSLPVPACTYQSQT
ncbi:hypothetical protein ANHA31_16410 [Anaerobutyricum hallii]|nr:hypothetical protein ANHA31_16410 [Anaerobutyricum hallii]